MVFAICLSKQTRYSLSSLWYDIRRHTTYIQHTASNIAKKPKYDGYQRGIASMVYKFFDKKTSDSRIKKCEYFKQRVNWRVTKTNYSKI